MGILLFILTNSALASLALGLVRRTRATGVDAWLYGLILFAGSGEFVTLVLGSLGLASQFPLVGVCLSLALIELRIPRAQDGPTPEVPRLAGTERAGIGVLIGLLALWAWHLSFDGVRYSWDDLSYHGTIVGWWLQNDTVAYAPYTYQVYYPLGAELASLWFSIPTESLAAANMPTLLWVAMLCVSALVFARRIGASYLATAFAVGCFLVSSRFTFFQITLTANDLAVSAALLAALATSIHPKQESDRGHLVRALIAGLATGMALGTKPSVAPQAFLLGVWWVISVFRGKAKRSSPFLFVLGCLFLGAYWYTRNWIVTGNPLFPAEIGPFEGPLTQVVQYKTSILYYIGDDGFWERNVLRMVNWPYAAGILVLLGFLGAPLISTRGIWSQRRNEYLPLWACALLFLLLYPIQPFSGTTNKPLSSFVFLPRYLSFPVAAGMILASSWSASSRKSLVTFVQVVFGGLFFACALAAGLQEILAAFAGALTLVVVVPRLWSSFSRHGFAVASGLIVLFALTLPHRSSLLAENIYTFTDYWPGWRRPKTLVREVWRKIDELPPGSRIGSLSYQASSHVHSFPLMGSALQHTAVRLHSDGSPRGRLHETWREEPDYWWWEFDQLEAAVIPEVFAKNLKTANLDYLVISHWPRNSRTPWPESRTAAMMTLEPEDIIYRDGYSMILKVR